jgi:hypothetical protein
VHVPFNLSRPKLLLWSLLLVALARYLWLAAYVHPYADDLSYAFVGMHSDLADRLLFEYRSWNGRYFSNILVLRGPMVLGWETGLPLYRLVPVLLLLATWWAAGHALRAFVGERLSRGDAALGGLFFLLVFLNAMPDLSEGIYWYTGAVTYQLPNILSLCLVAAWCRHIRSRWNSPLWRLLWIGLLTVVIAGCNEQHMALLVVVYMAVALVRRLSSGGWSPMVVAMLLLALLCLLAVGLAPGNAVRAANFPEKHQLLHTVLWSVVQTARFIALWLGTTMLLPTSVLFLALWRSVDHVPHWCRMNKWAALAIPVGVVLISMVLPYWSTGILGQYRTVNAALFLFLPAWFVALAVWDVQVFRQRWRYRLPERGTMQMALVVAALFLVWNNDRHVTTDLLSGRMARYAAAVEDRHERVRAAVAAGAEEVVVPPFAEEPRSLVIVPLQPDGEKWVNDVLARYCCNAELRVLVGPTSR